jgi:hypothetical protein
MTHAAVRSALIQALAEKKRRPPEELEKEMLAAGSECPYDSVWLVKAGVRAARRMGFTLKPKASDKGAFKSIAALTDYLCAVAEKEAVA